MNAGSPIHANRCPDCETVLANTLPAGLCPVCLLQNGFAATDSEVEARHGRLSVTQTQSWDPYRSSSPATSEREELVAGQQFGDYRIVRRLGRGGMGTVYEADHHPTGRRVALKVLAQDLNNREARARFFREGRLAASINHPNSVYVYGTEEVAGTPTISMELIRGGTLQQWIALAGPVDASAAADAVLQIIDGLEAADQKGVLHRDVKPANCFIDPAGEIKVGDFGLSITTESRGEHPDTQVTQEGTFLGTPAFASPEQLRGEPLDRRSDIYSVGVTLFYLLTGRTPFAGENMVQLLATVLDKPAPTVQSIRPEVSEEMSQVVSRCLQKSAGQRFSSYEELREALIPLSSRTQTPAPLGNRLLANLMDVFVLSVISFVLTFSWRYSGADLYWVFVGPLVAFLYYSISEWRYGKTVGKSLMGLRVVSLSDSLRFSQSAIRAAVFCLLPQIPNAVSRLIVGPSNLIDSVQGTTGMILVVGLSNLSYFCMAGIFFTMRKRNGYAALQGLWSGTRVVAQPERKRRLSAVSGPESFESRAEIGKIGPYDCLEELWQSESGRLVLCYDAQLLRRVWLHCQAPGAEEVDQRTRDYSRVGRLRWLGAKRSAEESWDCYEAPSGRSFLKTLGEGSQDGSVDWKASLEALRGLATELSMSKVEGSLSPSLTLENCWVTDENDLKLLPFSPAVGQQSVGDGPAGDAIARRLLHEAKQEVLNAFSLAVIDRPEDALPLSVSRDLAQMSESDPLDETASVLTALSDSRHVSVERRVRGMLVASLFIPVAMIASSLVTGLMWSQEARRHPMLKELARDTVQLRIFEQRLETYKSRPGFHDQRQIGKTEKIVEATRTWIAGTYA
ncbi:MAG: protein kinase, partial [Rubripirellula sp.]